MEAGSGGKDVTGLGGAKESVDEGSVKHDSTVSDGPSFPISGLVQWRDFTYTGERKQ